MSDETDLVRGSGNVFSDLGMENPQLRQLKALLAAQIIRVLGERNLTVRKAQETTGIAAADFSRIRQVKLDRFTVDRLMTILDRLGIEVEVSINLHGRRSPRAPSAQRLPA